MSYNLYGFVVKLSGPMKQQFVSQLLKRFNAFYDNILLYYTAHF